MWIIEEGDAAETKKNILQNDMIELSNNLSEQIICHINMNLKNCLNIKNEELTQTSF